MNGLGAIVDHLAALKRRCTIREGPTIESHLTIAGASVEMDRRLWRLRRRLRGPLAAHAQTWLVECGCAALRPAGHRQALSSAGGAGLARLRCCTCRFSTWSRAEPMHGEYRLLRGALRFGEEALRHTLWMFAALAEFGPGYYAAFYVRDRHILIIEQLLFDRSDEAMCRAIDAPCCCLINDAGFSFDGTPLAVWSCA